MPYKQESPVVKDSALGDLTTSKKIKKNYRVPVFSIVLIVTTVKHIA